MKRMTDYLMNCLTKKMSLMSYSTKRTSYLSYLMKSMNYYSKMSLTSCSTKSLLNRLMTRKMNCPMILHYLTMGRPTNYRPPSGVLGVPLEPPDDGVGVGGFTSSSGAVSAPAGRSNSSSSVDSLRVPRYPGIGGSGSTSGMTGTELITRSTGGVMS